MDLGELLEELRDNILHDRTDQIAGASDYLWSDRTLIRYIDQAQRRMAREALMIRDRQILEVAPFTREYPLRDDVIAVMSARCRGDKADLARAGHANFNQYYQPNAYFFDPSSLNELPPGKMRAWDTDEFIRPDDHGSMGRMNFRVYPIPDPLHVQPIELRVIRMPKHLSIGDYKYCHEMPEDERRQCLRAVPEIPEENHLDMLDWAAHLALRIADRDREDIERSDRFGASFETKVVEARDIAMRKFFAVQQWGFGRNAWSWEQN